MREIILIGDGTGVQFDLVCSECGGLQDRKTFTVNPTLNYIMQANITSAFECVECEQCKSKCYVDYDGVESQWLDSISTYREIIRTAKIEVTPVLPIVTLNVTPVLTGVFSVVPRKFQVARAPWFDMDETRTIDDLPIGYSAIFMVKIAGENKIQKFVGTLFDKTSEHYQFVRSGRIEVLNEEYP